MTRRCDIDDKKNQYPIEIANLSPVNYDPNFTPVRRNYGVFTLKPRFPTIEEIKHEQKPGPGPVYIPHDHIVKPTRYNNILAGGHAAKDYYKPDKNPGPGEYEIPDIADKSYRYAKSYRTSQIVRQQSLMMT
jgi:hypothetical protein